MISPNCSTYPNILEEIVSSRGDDIFKNVFFSSTIWDKPDAFEIELIYLKM